MPTIQYNTSHTSQYCVNNTYRNNHILQYLEKKVTVCGLKIHALISLTGSTSKLVMAGMVFFFFKHGWEIGDDQTWWWFWFMIVMMKYFVWKGWQFVWSSFFIFWIVSYHNVPRSYHCVSHSSISCPANQQPTLSFKWSLDTVGDRHSWSHPQVAKKLCLF